MRIYTKTGDGGETGLIGGVRVSKAHIRVEAYGSVDETNALLGVARALKAPSWLDRILEPIQHDLFVLGAELATPSSFDKLRTCPERGGAGTKSLLKTTLSCGQRSGLDVASRVEESSARRAPGAVAGVTSDDVARLERWIDQCEEELEPLRQFVLPGGSVMAAHLHHARTVCRRAERAVVALAAREPVGELVVPYLNRLADLLFVLARLANRRAHVRETVWSSRRGRVRESLIVKRPNP